MTRIDEQRARRSDLDPSAQPIPIPTPRAGRPPAAHDAAVESRIARAPESPDYAAFVRGIASGAAGTAATSAASAASAISPSDAAAARARQKLDAVRDAFSGPYTVDGASVRVRPMFRMNGEAAFNAASMKAHSAELIAICQRAKVGSPYLPQIGRPSPQQLVKITQALIDAGKLPPPPGALDERIRKMQWTWGIGVDCAGYTAQAALAVHGQAARPLTDNGHDNFALITQPPTSFAKVALANIRPGDVIHLNAPRNGDVGHNVIVYDHAIADASKRAELAARAPGASAFVAGPGPFHVLVVDSSWGAGDGNDFGGFRRDTWIYDEGTRCWGSFSPATPTSFEISARGPQDDPFAGAYRPRAR